MVGKHLLATCARRSGSVARLSDRSSEGRAESDGGAVAREVGEGDPPLADDDAAFEGEITPDGEGCAVEDAQGVAARGGEGVGVPVPVPAAAEADGEGEREGVAGGVALGRGEDVPVGVPASVGEGGGEGVPVGVSAGLGEGGALAVPPP